MERRDAVLNPARGEIRKRSRRARSGQSTLPFSTRFRMAKTANKITIIITAIQAALMINPFNQ